MEYAKRGQTAHCVLFERKGVASQKRFIKSLLKMKLNLTEGMETRFLKFDKMVRELNSNRNFFQLSIDSSICEEQM